MAHIARDNGFEHKADRAEEIMSHLDTDGELFARCVGGIWEKEGVAEMDITSNVPVGDAQAFSKAFKHQQRLYTLVAMLIEKLQGDGMYYPQLEGDRSWYIELAGKST